MTRLRFRDNFRAFGMILQRRDLVRLIAAEEVRQSLLLARACGRGGWSRGSGGWRLGSSG